MSGFADRREKEGRGAAIDRYIREERVTTEPMLLICGVIMNTPYISLERSIAQTDIRNQRIRDSVHKQFTVKLIKI
jgi:hypothetical protein